MRETKFLSVKVNYDLKKMKLIQKTSYLFVILVFLLVVPGIAKTNEPRNTTIGSDALKADFQFQLINSTKLKLDAYSGKPIILDWAASWCTICEANQKNMKALYPKYSDYVNFLSISYGNSGDDLAAVSNMKQKGGFQWDFGLDINKLSNTYKTTNGYVWVLDSSLNVVKTFNYTIVSQSQMEDALNALVTLPTTAGAGTTSTNPAPNSPSNTLFDNLISNPLFLAFGAAIALMVVYVLIKRVS